MSDKIYDYVIKTPANTNGNILHSLLNNSGTGNLDDFIAGRISDITCKLEYIPDYAFSGKKDLERVNLPNAIYIGKSAFSMPVGAASSSSTSDEGGESSEDLIFNNQKLTTVKFDNVTNIAESAFYGDTNLTITELPDTLLVIGPSAFAGCPNVQLTRFPRNIINIGTRALVTQNNIDLNTIPNSLIYIGEGCLSREIVNQYLSQFADGSIIDLSLIPSHLFEIDFYLEPWNTEGIFKDFSLNTAIPYIPTNISRIGRGTYYHKIGYIGSHQDLIIPNNIIEIGDYAFAGNADQILNLTLGSGLTKIGMSAFQQCRIFTLIIPDNVQIINSGAFYDCPITELVIGNGVVDIGYNAFSHYNISDPWNVKLGNHVEHIGGSAFEAFNGVLDLTSFDVASDYFVIPLLLDDYSAQFNQATKILFKNQETLNAFSNATNWSIYADKFEVKTEE